MRLFGYVLPLAFIIGALFGYYYYAAANEKKISFVSSMWGNNKKLSIFKKTKTPENNNNNNNKNNKMTSTTSIAADISGFGYNLFSAANDNKKNGGGNVLISPYCVASALSLAAAGSTPSSACESELFSALGLKHSHEEMSNLRAMLDLSSKDTANSSGVELVMANSIWTSKAIKPEYVSLVKNSHGAAAKALPSQYKPIDKWISKQTNGLVSDVLSGDVDPLVVALLVSVVRFQGTWTEEFKPRATRDGIFRLPDGQNRTARFMSAMRHINVIESVEHLGGASVLRLDYGNSTAGAPIKQNNKNKKGNNNNNNNNNNSPNEFCALFFLPKEDTEESMNRVISGLADHNDKFSTMLSSFENKLGSLSLPRFRVDWGPLSLREPMMNQRIGIRSAFGGSKSMFSQMSDDPDVHLDDVVHKVVMEVTEKGTTAAAAAVAVMKSRSLPRPKITLKFDRPFVMIVLHVPTSTPLFIGKMADPDFVF